ncbi:MAG: hypothetical protein LBO63_07820 [Oscillospiraceae bacterium]|jgi:hypothetical protein|nr:hypothetical protein [Oscillospiraceae bacterium]
MPFYFWISFLPLIIVLWEAYNDDQREKWRHIHKRIISKKAGKTRAMSEIIKEFIGKECIISTMKAEVVGVVESVQDNWIKVHSAKKDGGTDIINVEYVSRIREYPRSKYGKKKLIVS